MAVLHRRRNEPLQLVKGEEELFSPLEERKYAAESIRFGRSSPGILSVDPGNKKMKEAEYARIKIEQSAASGVILKTAINGVEYKMEHYWAVGQYHGYKIMIPDSHLLPNYEEVIAEIEKTGMQRNYLKSLIHGMSGLEVEFIAQRYAQATNAQDNAVVVGSRVQAMAVQRKRYWFATYEEDGKEIFRMKEGSVVEGRIINVRKGSIRVEIFGAEETISKRMLSFIVRQTEDLYHVNEIITLELESIERDPKTEQVHFTASRMNLERADLTRALAWYQIGEDYLGKITYITHTRIGKDGRILSPGIFVTLPQGPVSCFCPFPDSRAYLPQLDDQVWVRITHKDEERLRMNGLIKKPHRQATGFL